MTRFAVAAVLLPLLVPAPAGAASQAVRAGIAEEVFRDCDPEGKGVVTRAELVACMGREDIADARATIAAANETARVASSLVAQGGGSTRRQSLIDMLAGSGVAADLLDRIPSREGDLVTATDIETARAAAMAELRDRLAPRMEAATENADDVLESLGAAGEGRIVRARRAAR